MDRRIKYSILAVTLVLSFFALPFVYEKEIVSETVIEGPNSTAIRQFEIYSTSEVYDLILSTTGIGQVRLSDSTGVIKTFDFTSSDSINEKIRFDAAETIEIAFINLDTVDVTFEFNLVYHFFNLDFEVFLIIGMLFNIAIIGGSYVLLNNLRWFTRKRITGIASGLFVGFMSIQILIDPGQFVENAVNFLIDFTFVLLYVIAAILFFVLFLKNRGGLDPLKLVGRATTEPGNHALLYNALAPLAYAVPVYVIGSLAIRLNSTFTYVILAVVPTLLLLSVYYIFRGFVSLGYFHSTPKGFGRSLIRFCVILMIPLSILLLGLGAFLALIYLPFFVIFYGGLTYIVGIASMRFGIWVRSSEHGLTTFVVTLFEFEKHTSIYSWTKGKYIEYRAKKNASEDLIV